MFNKTDVITVAKAMIDPESWSEGYFGDYNTNGYTCVHCDGKIVDNTKDFKHTTNCPVLVAQDLLTGE